MSRDSLLAFLSKLFIDKLGLIVTKPVFGVLTKRVSNQSPQLQGLARKLKFYL